MVEQCRLGNVHTTRLTGQCRSVSEGSHLRVRQTGEERDYGVHHVLIIDDTILTLAHQHRDEFAKA